MGTSVIKPNSSSFSYSTMPSSANWNDYYGPTKAGFWAVGSTSSMSNKPSHGQANGILWVISHNASSMATQIYITSQYVSFRRRAGSGSWSSWKDLSGTQQSF